MKDRYGKAKTILTTLMYVAIFYAIAMFVQVIYTEWQSYIGCNEYEVSRNANNNVYALSVISTLITFWVYFFMGKIRKEPLSKVISDKKNPLIIALMAICLAVGMRMLVTVYYSLSQNIEILKESIDRANEYAPLIYGNTQLIIILFSVCVVAPIFEEVLFRGIVFHELMKIMRPWAAIVFQALLFGLSHGILFQSLFTFVVGIVLGIVYYRTQSIRAVALCHGAFNASELLIQFELTNVSCVVMSVMGVLLSALSLSYIIFTCRRN